MEKKDSSERGMNPVAMTIINPRTEYWPSQGSNQGTPVLKSAKLQTEPWGSAQSYVLVSVHSHCYSSGLALQVLCKTLQSAACFQTKSKGENTS